MGFAPTWLRQVSPPPLLHMTILTTGPRRSIEENRTHKYTEETQNTRTRTHNKRLLKTPQNNMIYMSMTPSLRDKRYRLTEALCMTVMQNFPTSCEA